MALLQEQTYNNQERLIEHTQHLSEKLNKSDFEHVKATIKFLPSNDAIERL